MLANRQQPGSAAGIGALAMAMAASLSACATVHVHNGDVLQTSRHFGIVSLSIAPGREQTTVTRATSLGLAFGHRSATLGYLDETAFIAPDAGGCHAFIFIKDREQASSIQQFLQSQPRLSQLCVLSPDMSKETSP